MKTGKLIVFSAPSGSGKTTLVHFLLSQALPLGFSISATSRTPRSNEQNGIDYNFMSPEQFQAKIKADEFLEYEEVYEKLFYGTLNSEVERLWKQEKHILFDKENNMLSEIKKKKKTKAERKEYMRNYMKKYNKENEDSYIERKNKYLQYRKDNRIKCLKQMYNCRERVENGERINYCKEEEEEE